MTTATYDAIVIGSGMTGGWAAKVLTEAGLNTLVLERGRAVKHGDYPTANKSEWALPEHNLPADPVRVGKPKQGRVSYTLKPDARHWFVNDAEHPYQEARRYDWIRGDHTGGRSLMWGRQCHRLSDLDFEANRHDGHGVDWPIRYADIAPWYDKVEAFIGVSGESLDVDHFPAGNYLPPMPLNPVEVHMQKALRHRLGRPMGIAPVAHNTTGKAWQGRGVCDYRNECIRGCQKGGYFSSLSGTLPAAEATGRMTLRNDAVVSELVYDPQTQRVNAVRFIDASTGDMHTVAARVVFCCASTVATTALLMNSISERFPTGLGNDSGELGHNLMDHHVDVGAEGKAPYFRNLRMQGRRPTGFYIPRFVNVNEDMRPYRRGYAFQGAAQLSHWQDAISESDVFGDTLMMRLAGPKEWTVGVSAYGEVLPRHDSHMRLSTTHKDRFGLPQVEFHARYGKNEAVMRDDMKKEAMRMLIAAGFAEVRGFDHGANPGRSAHEMGTARMGRDPRTSVLNKWNQIHSVPNVFVTDGACMTSSACQSPSLTYMALTARAADYAVKEIRAGRI